MSPNILQEDRERAFALYGEGRYAESYAECLRILEKEQDQQILVLAATNLYRLGKYSEAALHFRDLLRKLPGSSHLHGYLGRCLEGQGDERAAAEYATAVLLDPANTDALRSYAGCLLSRGDDRRAVPVLERLVHISGNAEDARRLISAMVRCGRAEDAVRSAGDLPVQIIRTPEYIDALFEAGEFALSAKKALLLFEEQGGTDLYRKYLRACARLDPARGLAAYEKCAINDDGILLDRITLLSGQERLHEALYLATGLAEHSGSCDAALIRCRLLEQLGEKAGALEAYGILVRTMISTLAAGNTLADVLDAYRTFLLTNYQASQAVSIFQEQIGDDQNSRCLVATGRLFEALGDATEARAWFYRAYRSDFLYGGLEYATYLTRTRDPREAEKVLLYILRNVKKTGDLVLVARMASVEPGELGRMPRALRALLAKLEERVDSLPDQGLSDFSALLLTGAELAAGAGDFSRAKEYSLRALDVLPAGSRQGTPLLALILSSKERALVDPPVFGRSTGGVLPDQADETVMTGPVLDVQEKKIVEFLKAHRRVSELDLRRLLGTRRVAGVMNRLIRKAASQGVSLVVKRGMGDHGEEYEYTGS
ncbi:MAG: hypothetical protein LUO88_03710 [Methanoregulaceae archaeon]|nr:hypothetical protein [Methanoregulaceae archaeon]